MAGFFQKMDKIKPVYDVAERVAMIICKLLLIADILITSMAVAGRYISFIPDPAWSEEIVLTLMSYMAVLSAAIAIRKKSHIRMTAFDAYLPKGVLKALDVLADICVLVLAVYMVKYGWQYTNTLGAKGSYISMPNVSTFWKYLPVPLAGVAMIIFELEALYNHVKDLAGKGGEN